MNKLFSLVLLCLAFVSCERDLWLDTFFEDGNENKYHIQTLKHKSINGSQGFAVYDNKCFVMQKGGTCYVYNYDNSRSPVSSFKLACSNQNTHCNCLNFGNEYVNESQYPLLYVSNGESGSPTELYCFVESLHLEDPFTYTANLVQVLILDKSNFKKKELVVPVACPQWLVDNERQQLWAFSLTTRSTVSAMGDMKDVKVVATCFELPKLADGDTIKLGAKDVVKQSIFEADAYILQAGCVKDGIIYMAYGYGGTGKQTPSKIRVYNTDTGEIDIRLDLDGIITDEPEDLYIYDNKLLLNTSGYIYSFDMNEIRRPSPVTRATSRNFIVDYNE